MSKLKQIVTVDRSNKKYLAYVPVDISEYQASEFDEKAASNAFVMDVLRKVMGKTLTIIDASFIDVRQNKALKDLFRGVFNEEMSFVGEMLFDQRKVDAHISSMGIDPDELGEPVEVEEVLRVNS